MEENFRGTIIEESLAAKGVLNKVKILKTRVEAVTERHQTPWIKQWTLHTVEVPADSAAMIAEEISRALDQEHAWYADFKNNTHHYIVFLNKIFLIRRSSQKEYDEAKAYGLALGLPDYQVDFSPDVK